MGQQPNTPEGPYGGAPGQPDGNPFAPPQAQSPDQPYGGAGHPVSPEPPAVPNWYGPPQGMPPARQHGPPVKPPYELAALGNWSVGLLITVAVLYGVSGVTGLAGVDGVQQVLWQIANVLLLGLIPVFMVWFYRARHNVAHLDPWGQNGRRSLGQGWSVGAWFVPVGFVWLPFQVALDIWRGTQPPGERRRFPTLLAAWWACWVLAWPFSFRYIDESSEVAGRTYIRKSVEFYYGSTWPSALLATAAAVLLVLVVRRITAAHTARFGF